MSKRSRRSRARDLLNEGQRYFDGGNYNGAVQAWEKLGHKTPTKLPTAKLAEAHFRRGLRVFSNLVTAPAPAESETMSHTSVVQDMQRAVELVPTEPRYHFHLGLAAQRQGDMATAIVCYRQARQNPGEFADRTAYLLAVALLAQGADPAADPLWSSLNAEQQGLLHHADAFRQRPYIVPDDAPVLLRALAILDQAQGQQEWDSVQSLLQEVLVEHSSPAEAGTAHFYLGVVAAQKEDWECAVNEWRAAGDAGFKNARLKENLTEALHRYAEELAQSEAIEAARAAAEEAAAIGEPANALQELLAHLYRVEGYQAAQAGQWDEALRHWEEATQTCGGSFRLAYNRALAYERAEDFFEAAEVWREVLRRRPRRTDHPDAISEEKVARLWRRAANCYVKVGEYDEAIQVYKTAVKYDPDNIETRMMLAEGLYHNGNIQAAENELQRILEKSPDHIPAMLLMAEVISTGGVWWQQSNAPLYWHRVLDLDPDNEPARHGLVEHYLDRAQQVASWLGDEAAIEYCEKALEVSPNAPYALALLGGYSLRAGRSEAGQAALERALENAGSNWDVRAMVCEIQLVEVSEEAFWSTLARIEAEEGAEAIPHNFYLSVAEAALSAASESIPPEIFERAIERVPEGVPIFTLIGNILMLSPLEALSADYFERAVKADEPIIDAYTGLILALLLEGKTKEAHHYWYQGRSAARKAMDLETMEALKAMGFALEAPPDWIRMMVRATYAGLPFSVPDFLNDFDDEDDDDYYFD